MSGYDDRNPVARVLGRPVRWMQILCGWALLAICFATLYDIVARRLFNHSVQGVNEIGAYLLAIDRPSASPRRCCRRRIRGSISSSPTCRS